MHKSDIMQSVEVAGFVCADLVSCERKGNARLFFQSFSSLKCCSFTAGGVMEGRKAAGLPFPVSLLNTVEQPVAQLQHG